MTNEPQKPMPLDYREPDPTVERQWRRILFCIGLPLLAFALAGGLRNEINGFIAAAGAFLVALVLTVR